MLRVAGTDPSARSVALAALAGGLADAARRFGSSQQWRRDETEAVMVAAAWEQIVGFAGDPPPWPAAVVVSRAHDRARRRLAADVRQLALQSVGAHCVADPADTVVGLVDLVTAARAVPPAAFRLVVGTRWAGVSLAEVSRATGESHAALRQRRSRAERALRAAA